MCAIGIHSKSEKEDVKNLFQSSNLFYGNL
jgi:hypothetical protein